MAVTVKRHTPNKMAFLYPPLVDNSKCIRVMTLPIERDGDGVLQLTLKDMPLLDSDALSRGTHTYAAISYEWGPETPLCELSIDGHQALVRQNIWSFLEHCCSTGLLDNPVNDMKIDSIWVDAICINQADIDEKNAQVQAMASIFWNACAVITWLGQTSKMSRLGEFIPTRKQHDKTHRRYWQCRDGRPELTLFQTCDPEWSSRPTDDLDAECGFRYPETIDRFLDVVMARAVLVRGTSAFTHGATTVGDRVKELDASDALDLQHGLLRIFSDSYWTRLWIVQEVILAQASYFVSGETLLETTVLDQSSSKGFQSRSDLHEHVLLSHAKQTVRLMGRIMDIRHTIRNDPSASWAFQYSLLDLVAKFAEQQCQDLRDHIFGLQGIAKCPGVTVDYNVSCERLFCMVLQSSFPEDEQLQVPLKVTSISELFSVLNLNPRQVEPYLDERRRYQVITTGFELLDSGRNAGLWTSVFDLWQEKSYEVNPADADDMGTSLDVAEVLQDNGKWFGVAAFADGPRLVYIKDNPRGATGHQPRSSGVLHIERIPPEVLSMRFCYQAGQQSLTLDLRFVLWMYEFVTNLAEPLAPDLSTPARRDADY